MSVVIGTITVPLLYTTGRKLLGHRGGLLAAFLLAISPFHIYYSQEIRMYGLVTLLGLLALISALQWKAEARRGNWVAWLGAVLAATAALYTQYYAAFFLLALNLIVLLRWFGGIRSVRSLLRWASTQVVAVALFLPWLWYAGSKLLTYIRFKVSVEKDPAMGVLAYIGRHLSAFDWGHAEGVLASWWWLGLLPLVVIGGTLVWSMSRYPLPRESDGAHRPRWLFVLDQPAAIILIIVFLCGFGVNLIFPFNPQRSERLLLLVLPAYLLLFARGMLALWRRKRWLAYLPGVVFVLMVLMSLSFLYTVPRYPDDDYRPLAERVSTLARPSDVILCVHPWQVGYFQAYLPKDVRPALELTPREVLPRERQLWADAPAVMARDLDALMEMHGRLWLPAHQAMGRVLERPIEAHLAQSSYPALSEWYGKNTTLSLFAAGQTEPRPISARFGDWLRLESVAMGTENLEAGWGILLIDLGWQISETPDESYHIGLRLTDGAGHVWAQRDTPPVGGVADFARWSPNEPYRDRHGLLIPAGTPPGEYQVTLRVYRSEDVAVLPVTFEGGSGGEVTLGAVRVVRPAIPPPVEALGFKQVLQADFGDLLQLHGITLPPPGAILPGDTIDVALFWEALTDPEQDLLPSLQIVDADGMVLAQLTEKPVSGTYPTAWWKTGQLVRDIHELPIPATVSPGRYDLTLSLVRATDGSPVITAYGQTSVPLAEIEVIGREHRYEPTVPRYIQPAQFGTSIALIGYDMLDVERAPGSPLEITLHWQALQTPERNYHSFVHVLDAAGTIVAQHDGPPGSEDRPMPTLGWLPGEYVTDTHRLQLPFDLPDGTYRLGVGLYHPNTNQPLGDRIVLDTLLWVDTAKGCLCP